MTLGDFAPPPLPGGTGPAVASADAERVGHKPGGGDSGPATHGSNSGRRRRGRKARARTSNGRWVLVTMITAIGLIVGGIGWASVLTYRASAVAPANQDATGSLHSGQVVTGMCLKKAPDLDSVAGPVEVVGCADPHHAEALVSYTFTSGEWPGEATARGEVVGFCAAQVDPDAGYFPATPDAPGYEWLAWVPSAGTWQLGDRTGVCVITTERPVTGSYGAGTARDAAADAVVS